MAQQPGLSVREHKRENVRLPVRFSVTEEHRTQVRFTSSSSAINQHSIFAVATDLSQGGLGLESGQYLPRMCEGTVFIYNPSRHADDAEQIQHQQHVIEARVKVRRIKLSDHTPSYTIGMSFLDPPESLNARIDELCRKAGDEISRLAGEEKGGRDA